MSTGYENAPVTQFVSFVSFILTVFTNPSYNIPLDVERVLQGEVWRLATSQIIFRNKAQAIVGLILLYTCRQFERQMGSRKFGAFLLFSLTTSILSLLGLIVIFASVGYNLVPSSGPYFLIFSLVAFYYFHIPKLHSSQYSLFGVEFSEKSWIYLLACQLILCDGAPSMVAAFSGLLAGFLYDRDGYGIQNYRLPQRVEAVFVGVGTLINSLLPQRNVAAALPAGRVQPPPAAPRGTVNQQGNGRQNLMNPFDINNYGGGGGNGLGAMAAGPTARDAPSMPRYPPPDEESIVTLMGLGFEREAVLLALQASGNNVEAAANRLFR